MLRIATFNVNGIRATQRRGFNGWLAARNPDVVALQEVRCPVPMLPEGVFAGYHLTYDSGQLAGRNGVAILSRQAPSGVRSWGAGALVRAPGDSHVELREPGERDPLARELKAFAHEGRYLEVDLADVPLTVASLYLPKGATPDDGPAEERLFQRKLRFLAGFARHLTAARRAASRRGRDLLVMGDFNIARSHLDIKNWRAKRRSAGFLPEEREWFESILGPRRLVDVVRAQHPDEQGPYSWWSWLGRAFDNNAGWRIDYHLATPGLALTALAAVVDRDADYEHRMSDHAPVVVDYAFPGS